MSTDSTKGLTSLMIALAVLAAMYVGAEFLKPVALAIVLGLVVSPLVTRIERWGAPRVVSATLAMLLLLAGIGGLGYLVTQQLMSLAAELPQYESNILAKARSLRSTAESPVKRISEVATHVQESIAPGASEQPTVRVVEDSSLLSAVQPWITPFQEVIGLLGVVLFLTFFALLEREQISDRLVQIVGGGRLTLTTRTLSQVTQRTSKYLITFSAMNLGFGVVIGVGLWLIGVPYGLLWGTLAAVFRFVPYLGPMVAFALPVAFTFARFEGWTIPLLTVGFYGTAEVIANSIEPVIYGKSTGVSALGLLVAAIFWTWIWGPLGLLLSTPLTVCLLVAGEHIRGLGFLASILAEEVEVPVELQFYQRILHRDQDGAIELLEAERELRPLEDVFDRVVMPALARANEDLVTRALDRRDAVYLWTAIQQWLEDLPLEENRLESPSGVTGTDLKDEPLTVVGLATGGVPDALVFRMLNALMASRAVRVDSLEVMGSTLAVTEQLSERRPDLILISLLPPVGASRARYLVRRLRVRLAEVPLIVGAWNSPEARSGNEALKHDAGTKVVSTLVGARDAILEVSRSRPAQPSLV